MINKIDQVPASTSIGQELKEEQQELFLLSFWLISFLYLWSSMSGSSLTQGSLVADGRAPHIEIVYARFPSCLGEGCDWYLKIPQVRDLVVASNQKVRVVYRKLVFNY